MAKLSIRTIYESAVEAGFSPEQAVTWTAIAMAESGGRSGAHNPKGEDSRGLWQINVAADEARETKWGDLYDPGNNARAAYAISRQGRDMSPWTTTHNHNKGTSRDYRTYLDEIEARIGVEGDHRGVSGYGSPMLPPLPDGSGDVAAGPSDDASGSAEDADRDGLSDFFEALAGTKVRDADSDSDGVADGYEAAVSHTDPLSPDTDNDQISDRDEIEARTDAGRLPGVAGVVGIGVFRERASEARDSDSDGLSDHTEGLVGTKADQADTDADQLSDAQEASLGTSPLLTDSDRDGLGDGLEVRYNSDPLGQVGLGELARDTPEWTLEDAAGQTSPATSGGDGSVNSGSRTALATFLELARKQAGDSYRYGADPAMTDANPESFDCSALVQWAAHRSGVKLERTAQYQYMQLKDEGALMDVDDALQTPGALLFRFSQEPNGNLRRGQAHVAISLGDGQVIEARGSSWGVGEWTARGRGFNYAARIPGISDEASVTAYQAGSVSQPTVAAYEIDAGMALVEAPTFRGADSTDADADADGLTDAFEKLARTNPELADSDADGLRDGDEAMRTRTDPLAADSDRDGVSDADEMTAGTDAGTVPGIARVVGSGQFAERVGQGFADSDSDGLSNRTERLLKTNAHKSDTDGDRLSDPLELSLGMNPLDSDSDRDGLADWFEAHSEPPHRWSQPSAIESDSSSSDPLDVMEP